MKTEELLSKLRMGEILFTPPERGLSPVQPLIQALKREFPEGIRATAIQDAPFTYEITLPTLSSIRISGFGKFATVTNQHFSLKSEIQKVISALSENGFIYIDEREMGPSLEDRSDLMEDNLFNRLFGYWSD